jgi:hypothetical protein
MSLFVGPKPGFQVWLYLFLNNIKIILFLQINIVCRHVSFFLEKDRCQKFKYQIWIMSIISFGNPDVILLLGINVNILDKSPIFFRD